MAHRVLSAALLVAPTTALSYDPARSLAPLHRLLLQRTVQTQTVYLTDFHDEAKAQWLANYLDPQAPMDTVRMSNTECLPRYNGLDGFPHATNEEYLRTMIRSEPITYEVRYKVGTWAGGNQGTGGAVGPSEEPAADEAFRKGMEQKQTLDFWGGSNNAAAASTRRNNPFLGEHTAKYREYEETIVPSRFAQLLMTTQQQLAKEWRRDLCAIYDGSLILPRDPDADEAQAIAAEQSLYARVIRDKAMGEDPDELGRFATSPLRAANLDLCERLATRVAARELCVDGDLSPAQARRLEECLERLESSEPAEPEAGPTDDIHAALAAKLETMTRVDALGGHARRRGLARRWLESLADEALADVVRRRRNELARHWAESVVDEVAATHALLLRESLESQLGA